MSAVVLNLPDQSAKVATAIVKKRQGKSLSLSVSNGDGKSQEFDFTIDTKSAPIDVQGLLLNAQAGIMLRVELNPKGDQLIQILPTM